MGVLELRELSFPQSFSELIEKMDGGSLPIAGGTDILPLCRDGKLKVDALADMEALRGELGLVYFSEDTLEIGALTTMDTLSRHQTVKRLFPALAQAAGAVGSQQIRNRATLGGNIVHASPAADSVPPLVAAGAVVVLRGAAGERSLLLEDFLMGPGKTALTESDASELLTAVRVPIPQEGWRGGYTKVGGRTALTISIASVAMLYSAQTGYRVAYGSVAARVRRALTLEEALTAGEEQRLSALIKGAISPISDVRASADYRRKLCVNLTLLARSQLQKEVRT